MSSWGLLDISMSLLSLWVQKGCHPTEARHAYSIILHRYWPMIYLLRYKNKHPVASKSIVNSCFVQNIMSFLFSSIVFSPTLSQLIWTSYDMMCQILAVSKYNFMSTFDFFSGAVPLPHKFYLPLIFFFAAVAIFSTRYRASSLVLKVRYLLMGWTGRRRAREKWEGQRLELKKDKLLPLFLTHLRPFWRAKIAEIVTEDSHVLIDQLSSRKKAK